MSVNRRKTPASNSSHHVRLNKTYSLRQPPLSSSNFVKKPPPAKKRTIRIIFTSIAFLFFFAMFIYFINLFILLGNFNSKNPSIFSSYYYYAINALPIIGGITILMSNHFFRYVKPFNDGVLFLYSAATAYFLLEHNFSYSNYITYFAHLIYGNNYQYASSLFLSMCLIGKAFIAFAEFYYQVKKDTHD